MYKRFKADERAKDSGLLADKLLIAHSAYNVPGCEDITDPNLRLWTESAYEQQELLARDKLPEVKKDVSSLLSKYAGQLLVMGPARQFLYSGKPYGMDNENQALEGTVTQIDLIRSRLRVVDIYGATYDVKYGNPKQTESLEVLFDFPEQVSLSDSTAIRNRLLSIN